MLKGVYEIGVSMSAMGGGLNGSTQHLVLVAKNGVYIEEPKEPSMIQGGKAAGPLEASGIAELR